MAGKKGQNDNEGPDEWLYLVILLIIVVSCWLLWTFARKFVVIPAFAVDYAILWIIDTVKGLGKTGHQYKDYVVSFFDGRSDPARDINFDTFATVRTVVGTQVRIFIVAAIVGMAGLIAFRMKGNGFKRWFSLAGGKGAGPSLALEQVKQWRIAAVSLHFQPDGRDKDILSARTPLEWLLEHDIKFENSELDRDAAEKVFEEQLGKPWHGVERAELHLQTIFLLSGMHLLRHKKSLEHRADIAVSWSSGSDGRKAMADFVAKALTDKKLVSTINKVCSKNAFAATALITLTDLARRKSGVLASNDFLWVKRLDRGIWYTLNNVGRRRFHTEGAGAMSHWFAERVVGNPMPEPHLDGAVNGIEDYLADHGIESRDLFFQRANTDEY
jgi:hypothetical protein